jgi:hypothetical protein
VADLYLDHNVAAQLAELLHARGHTAQTVGSFGLATASDDALLLRAAQDACIFVTHNWSDFRLLHDAWRRWSAAWAITATHAGVLVILTRPVWDTQRAAEEIDRLLTALPDTGHTVTNQLYRWHRDRGWVQY